MWTRVCCCLNWQSHVFERAKNVYMKVYRDKLISSSKRSKVACPSQKYFSVYFNLYTCCLLCQVRFCEMDVCIDDYIFSSILGKGTFGTVYFVRRKKDLKPFVIKAQDLRTKYSPSKRVLGEVLCLQKLRHPNIVMYYGAWEKNNHSYILMEYATRCTLKDLLENRKMPLKEEDALYLFSQITLGVHHIHSNKILHRDLKPENIMLTGSRGDIVKIGDFGLSKNIVEDSITSHAGSYYYMAPEVLALQPYELKCDIWSMGVILYEMITKKRPFPATSLAEITRLVHNCPPEPLPHRVSAIVVNLISKMLRKQISFRPRTDQLVLCPFLAPYIVRVYLNLGRRINIAERERENFKSEIFLKFLNLNNKDFNHNNNSIYEQSLKE